MIRRFVDGLRAMLAAAQAHNDKVSSTVSGGNAIDVEYIAAKMAKHLKRRRRGLSFNYSSLNPHGCPWPGRAAARARHRAGSGRRPK